MKFLTKMVCLAALVSPLLANAAEVTIKNDTSRTFNLRMGNLSSERQLTPNGVVTISEEAFKGACSYSPNKCIFKIVDSGSYEILSDITLNSHDGVIGVLMHGSNLHVAANRFTISLSPR